MICRFKVKTGMTLIELILSIVIFSIVIMGIYNFLLAGNRTFASGAKQYDVQSDLRIVSDYIVRNTRFATSLSLVDNSELTAMDTDYDYMFINNGHLNHYISNGSTHQLFMTGLNITTSTFSGSVNGEKAILTIDLDETKDDQTYELNTTTELKNLTLKREEIITTGNGNVIKFSKLVSLAYALPTPTPGSTPVVTPTPTLPPMPTPTPTEAPTPTPTLPAGVTPTIGATPTPTPTPEVVSVNFYTQSGSYSQTKMDLYGTNYASMDLASADNKNYYFLNVPINGTYTYRLWKRIGQTYVLEKTDTVMVNSIDYRILLTPD